MSEWKARRFWTSATVAQHMDGFTVDLDNRPIRTPLKAPLVVPSHAMAEAIAAEWMAQDSEIKPLTMPVTRSVNAAIDKVRSQKDEVVALLAAYAETDLLCHRAEQPQELTIRQEQAWRPPLAWIEQQLGVSLVVTKGVLPVPQPAESLAIVHRHIGRFDIFSLTALHDLITISGSAVLGLAVIEGQLSSNDAWTVSRIDEDFQAELWGQDEEAVTVAQKKCEAFLHAARFHALLRS